MIVSIIVAVISFLLARDKGRHTVLWTVLGLIPFINYICPPYFIGASNARVEEKNDRLLGGR